MNNLPEVRRRKLKDLLNNKDYITVMEASNGLSGIVVENTKVDGKEYDAIWISSLCDSLSKGKPDNEVVDFNSRVNTINEIMEVTTKPIIVDGDTGGKIEHLIDHVKTLERIGVSAIVIEDKKGLKQNSLLGKKVSQILEDKYIFANKITQAKKTLSTDEFMIFARIESFIAGNDINDALDRAEVYVKAGADGIMIHSYKKDGKEIKDFLNRFKKSHPNIITIVVPTTYSQMNEQQLKNMGANIIIYANHLLRSAYMAMVTTATAILKDECCENASKNYCTSINEILELIGEKND